MFILHKFSETAEKSFNKNEIALGVSNTGIKYKLLQENILPKKLNKGKFAYEKNLDLTN